MLRPGLLGYPSAFNLHGARADLFYRWEKFYTRTVQWLSRHRLTESTACDIRHAGLVGGTGPLGAVRAVDHVRERCSGDLERGALIPPLPPQPARGHGAV